MSQYREDGTSTRASTEASKYEADISYQDSEAVGKPRVGLGSTSNENIALRRNYRELELLWKTQKTLVDEEEYVLKLLDLYEKSVQLSYKRLTKRVKKIKSHLTEEEIIEMENDLRKKEFADKYRMLLHDQEKEILIEDPKHNQDDYGCGIPSVVSLAKSQKLEVIKEESDETPAKAQREVNNSALAISNSKKENKREISSGKQIRSQTCKPDSTRLHNNLPANRRPETTPNINSGSEAVSDIIPSLEMLLDQLHNIKPHQFYENQRKLKLYEIRLLGEELEEKKSKLFKAVDQIVNWDKKEEIKEEEVEEVEEKPRERKTSFMRSVIRNFSMELMMKTMQYGWTDLGQCRYLRTKGGNAEDADTAGTNTLAKDTMKIRLDAPPLDDDKAQASKPRDPGFDENGRMIRTADLLGLK